MSGSCGTRAAALALAAACVAGCGGSGGVPPPAQPYADRGYVEAAGQQLHYALTPTPDLPADVARRYGVERRPDRALLALTLSGAGGADASASATAIALTGERAALPLRRSPEAGAATWIAVVAIRHRVPITIEASARSAPGAAELRARFTREFRLE